MSKPKASVPRGSSSGDTSSGINQAGRPWTPAEMGAAVPMPIPDPADADGSCPEGRPHAGEGNTSAAGPPEPSDDARLGVGQPN